MAARLICAVLFCLTLVKQVPAQTADPLAGLEDPLEPPELSDRPAPPSGGDPALGLNIFQNPGGPGPLGQQYPGGLPMGPGGTAALPETMQEPAEISRATFLAQRRARAMAAARLGGGPFLPQRGALLPQRGALLPPPGGNVGPPANNMQALFAAFYRWQASQRAAAAAPGQSIFGAPAIPAQIPARPNVPAQPAPINPQAQLAPLNPPAQPAPVNVPAQPAPVNVPVQLAPVNVPAQPAPVNVPAQPAPVNVPAQPAPVPYRSANVVTQTAMRQQSANIGPTKPINRDAGVAKLLAALNSQQSNRIIPKGELQRLLMRSLNSPLPPPGQPRAAAPRPSAPASAPGPAKTNTAARRPIVAAATKLASGNAQRAAPNPPSAPVNPPPARSAARPVGPPARTYQPVPRKSPAAPTQPRQPAQAAPEAASAPKPVVNLPIIRSRQSPPVNAPIDAPAPKRKPNSTSAPGKSSVLVIPGKRFNRIA